MTEIIKDFILNIVINIFKKCKLFIFVYKGVRMRENKIYFVDVTNRDGVQTSRLGLAKLQKTIINLMLDDMGITQSEFGFPTTQHEINYLNGNWLKEVLSQEQGYLVGCEELLLTLSFLSKMSQN